MKFLALLALVAASLTTLVTAAPVSTPVDADLAAVERDFIDSVEDQFEGMLFLIRRSDIC